MDQSGSGNHPSRVQQDPREFPRVRGAGHSNGRGKKRRRGFACPRRSAFWHAIVPKVQNISIFWTTPEHDDILGWSRISSYSGVVQIMMNFWTTPESGEIRVLPQALPGPEIPQYPPTIPKSHPPTAPASFPLVPPHRDQPLHLFPPFPHHPMA